MFELHDCWEHTRFWWACMCYWASKLSCFESNWLYIMWHLWSRLRSKHHWLNLYFMFNHKLHFVRIQQRNKPSYLPYMWHRLHFDLWPALMCYWNSQLLIPKQCWPNIMWSLCFWVRVYKYSDCLRCLFYCYFWPSMHAMYQYGYSHWVFSDMYWL